MAIGNRPARDCYHASKVYSCAPKGIFLDKRNIQGSDHPQDSLCNQ
ncbi:MAG: hypothetical protein H7318_03980 [Oligoflexus sp.]|nr:hypothetical protein [Oligoflexus sp.]